MGTPQTPIRRPRRQQLNTTLDESLIEHDEEEERKQRRSMVQMRRSVAANRQNKSATNDDSRNVPMEVDPTAADLALLRKTVSLDDRELKIHFDLCRKLLVENKITMKNAWSLHIIDYMNEVIQHKYHGNDTFQTAAVTLEICAKVYECRVDDLHSDGVRLARALAAAGNSNAEELSDHEADGEAAAGPKTKAKRKRKKFVIGNKQTVCKNPETLCGIVPQVTKLHFAVDADGDPEQTANLFSFVVPIDHNYNEHLNDSVNPGFLSYNINDDVNTKVIGKYKPKTKKGFKICKDFLDFEVNKPDPTLEDSMMNSIIVDHGAPLGIAAQVFDDNGQPIVELDGSFHDPFVDDNNHDDIIDEEIEQGFCNVRRVPITSFGPHLASINQENLGSSETLDADSSKWMKTIWIGPSHWKNKLVRPTAARFTGRLEQKPVMKRTKRRVVDEDTPIDFLDRDTVKEVDFNCKGRPRKVPKIKKTLVIPRNYLQYEEMNRLSLTNYLPDHVIKADPKGSGSDEAFEHNPYDYNNLNDSQYCPENNGADDVFDDPNPDHPEHETVNNPIAEHADGPFDGGVMADIPVGENAFDKSYEISPPKPIYATKAKNVNMRKIREAMWTIISRGAVTNEETGTISIQHTKFTTVFDIIMSEMPASLTKGLSIQIGFFALLQIVQEGCVMLKSINNNADALILPSEKEKYVLPMM